jgi:hypothetical protein
MAFHLSRSTPPKRQYRGDVDGTVSFTVINHFEKYGILRRKLDLRRDREKALKNQSGKRRYGWRKENAGN